LFATYALLFGHFFVFGHVWSGKTRCCELWTGKTSTFWYCINIYLEMCVV
jgi:fido (protein-threonine AMPylation protein)